MKITEEKLKSWACTHFDTDMGGLDEDEESEIFRLIRLGMWAEEHGIRALKRFESFACQTEDSFRQPHLHEFKMEMPAKEALAALPTAPAKDSAPPENGGSEGGPR